jgi:hypothetical protein
MIREIARMGDDSAWLTSRTAAEVQKRYFDTIERAIAEAGRSRERVMVEATDGTEAYAYPHQRGIAWGVNAAGSGANILRGVRRQDGQDEAVG